MIQSIEIRGAYGETNFGDDLLMTVFENYFLKETPTVKLNFNGENESYVSNLLNNSSYLDDSFNPELVVYGGGTQFFAFSHPKKLSRIGKVIKILRRPSLIVDRIFSQNELHKKSQNQAPTVFLGFGIGPFYVDSHVKTVAKDSLSASLFVGVRDEVSFEYCEQWGIPSILGADVVFSSYFSLPKFENTNNYKKKIGIIVRDWNWEQSGADYIDSLIDLELEDENQCDIVYIIFAPLKDKKWIKLLSNKNVLIWDPNKFSINQFLETINSFDALISARYHGAIIGALLGKPVICIEIEDKLKILTNQLPQLKLWRKPFEKGKLLDLIRNLEYDVDYSESLMLLKNRADMMFERFKKGVIDLPTNLDDYEN